MQHTTQFLQNRASVPEGAENVTEVPGEVTAEINAAGLSIGGFLSLLPEILALVRLFTAEGTTLAEAVAAIFSLIQKLQPGE